MPTEAERQNSRKAIDLNDALLGQSAERVSKNFNPAQQRVAIDYATALQRPEFGMRPGQATLQASGGVYGAGSAYSNYTLPSTQEPQSALLPQQAPQQQSAIGNPQVSLVDQSIANLPPQLRQGGQAQVQQQPALGNPRTSIVDQAMAGLPPPLRQGGQAPAQQQPLTQLLISSMMGATGPYQGQQGMGSGYAQPNLGANNGINFAPQGYGGSPSAPEAGTKAWYDAMGPGQRELLSAMQTLQGMSTNPMDGPSSLGPNGRVVTGLTDQREKVAALAAGLQGMGSARGPQLTNETVDSRTGAVERTGALQVGAENARTAQQGRQAALSYDLGEQQNTNALAQTNATHALDVKKHDLAQRKAALAEAPREATFNLNNPDIPWKRIMDDKGNINLKALIELQGAFNPPDQSFMSPLEQ